jgi:hypothetical protein
LEPFFEELTKAEKSYAYFQQGSAAIHTTENSVLALWSVFDEQTISRGLWPSHSLDLNVCAFHLWENLEQKFYRNNPCTLEALQIEIRSVIVEIMEGKLQHVINLLHQCEMYLGVGRHHSEQLLQY